jgi:hypothetical protein
MPMAGCHASPRSYCADDTSWGAKTGHFQSIGSERLAHNDATKSPVPHRAVGRPPGFGDPQHNGRTYESGQLDIYRLEYRMTGASLKYFTT